MFKNYRVTVTSDQYLITAGALENNVKRSDVPAPDTHNLYIAFVYILIIYIKAPFVNEMWVLTRVVPTDLPSSSPSLHIRCRLQDSSFIHLSVNVVEAFLRHCRLQPESFSDQSVVLFLLIQTDVCLESSARSVVNRVSRQIVEAEALLKLIRQLRRTLQTHSNDST